MIRRASDRMMIHHVMILRARDRGASDHLGFGFSGTAGGTGDVAVSFSVLVENEVN